MADILSVMLHISSSTLFCFAFVLALVAFRSESVSTDEGEGSEVYSRWDDWVS